MGWTCCNVHMLLSQLGNVALQVINSCVGQGNARLFLAYCMTLLPAQLLFLHLVAAFCRFAAQAPHAGVFPALWRASAWHPGVVLLALVQVPSDH
jgi:hypothetical protein